MQPTTTGPRSPKAATRTPARARVHRLRRLRAGRVSRLRALTARRAGVLGILAAALLASVPDRAHAQEPEPIVETSPGEIELNFQDVDLAYVLSALAQAASLNIMYLDLPEEQITLRTAEPIPLTELPGLIRTLAEANRLTMIEDGGFIRLRGPIGEDEDEGPDLRQLFIYRLRHARATILAPTLRALFGGDPMAAQTAAGQQQQTQTLSQQLRAAEIQVQTVEGEEGGQVVVAQAGGAAELEGNVQIVPDEVTNALLIRATPADWMIIQEAVQALDLRPLQVAIEVVIAEVRRNDDLDVGVRFGAERETEDRTVTGRLGTEEQESDFSVSVNSSGDIDIEATLAALSRTGRVRILSRPVVMAQNNREARILVGSERPFVQVARTLPTDNPIRDQIIQYREVGTVLTILPTINEEGYVNLALTQEVSSATTETQFDAPVISTREAATQILARDGQTVVIGGLVDRQDSRVREGVPFLKDIPVLGFLFGSTRDEQETSELFLFLTPRIVASDEDAERVRQQIQNRTDLLEGLVPIVPLLSDTLPALDSLPPRRMPPPDTIRIDPVGPDTVPPGRR